ncbi:MAG: 4-hydroxybutyrate--acetyl-CoA CoA transferase [Candidatus Eremiobacteraeota bacterium]|nr:4-hydroxybutyrate--acetyl-CoA CoA transferase [Candidatus Eremiobacteraeota bacterium]
MGHYTEEYNKKLTTPQKAVECIKKGDVIVYGMSVAQPPALLAAIADRARQGNLENIKVYNFLPLEHAMKTVLDPALADRIEGNSWFVGGQERGLIRTGLNYFVPSYLHQVPRMCREFMDIDVCVTTVSPMDRYGFFTFGTANDLTSTAARQSKTLIVEVNENMPRVFGDSLLHISEVDAIVENHVPILELKIPATRPEDEVIGNYIADMIPDGATLQLGIGGLPNVVACSLSGHKDMGVHSELLTEGMIDLIKKGVITGRKKNLNPMKHVFTTASGTKAMYEFMNDNPSIESYPASYVCAPGIIAQNDNMIAVNSIIEVDLTGQVNAEFLGGTTFSGTGGQLDFVRGAFDSKGGKSIHAFYSTAKRGEVSRVVPRMKEGAVVTTPRADTHYLATEYGVVNLKGKSTRERAHAIIGIAHPKFREWLAREAENMYLI